MLLIEIFFTKIVGILNATLGSMNRNTEMTQIVHNQQNLGDKSIRILSLN